jgi:hypothetical protein
MKEIKLRQQNAQLGEITVHIRIIKDIIYIKTNNNQYSEQLLTQLSSKGATILRGRGWLQIRLFKPDMSIVRLGGYEFNLKEDSQDKIETCISNFYLEQYIKSGFEEAKQ